MKKDPYAPLREQMSQPPTHWRSIEHQSGEESVVKNLEVEFPSGAMQPDGFNRREALLLAGASLALGSMACDKLRRPVEEILPYTHMPESVIPGVRMLYATAMPRSEGAVGLVVEAHEGRPTKIEGNPLHPSSLGGTDVWAQAEILKLYDPDRARAPLQAGKPSTWEAWDTFCANGLLQGPAANGHGLAFLLEEDGGPTFERLLKEASQKLPEAKIYRWDPLAADQAQAGAQLAFGPGSRLHFDLEKAKIIFALDSNFLVEGPDHLRLARQFASHRVVLNKAEAAGMNRLYVAEGVFSATGTNADHRVRVSSGHGSTLLKVLARQLASKHGLELGELGGLPGAAPEGTDNFLSALASDLAANKGAAIILVGERQPSAVHALAAAINLALGAGSAGVLTVTRSPDAAVRTPLIDSLSALTRALNALEVQTLVVFDANPLYTAPGALKFADALAKAKSVIHVGVLPEETGLKADWHLPAAHFLEAWGDARAWDGTASIIQPLILPLFGARPATSLLARIAGFPPLPMLPGDAADDRHLVEATWRSTGQPLADTKAWRRALHDGVIANTARTPGAAEAQPAAIAMALAQVKSFTPGKDTLELAAIHGHLRDGRLANVTWLQELPDGMSKLCWDNAVLVSPALAKELSIASAVHKNAYDADVVELEVDGRKLTAPCFVLPGLAKYTVAMVIGYGKTAGAVAKGVGVAVTPLLSDGTLVVQGVKLTRTGAVVQLCSTQDHFSVPADPFHEMTFAQMTALPVGKNTRTLGLGKRPLLRTGTSAEYLKAEGKFAHEGDMPEELVQPGTAKTRPALPIQLHSDVVYGGQQWGMTIDLASCTGCNACTIACVAENNIPVVGREQVLLGRELHWIRIDRYFQGDIDDPKAAHQPIQCMHCENAPCEPVCPVGATVHDDEGLNAMAYNRCIGTRYCANNCPFKVRRFNYLDYTTTGILVPGNSELSTVASGDPAMVERMKSLRLQRNPDVTVRYRGVMEKCSYCTQRVEEAKIAAKRAGQDRKALPDGAVLPACAQACPSQAITFGNINDPLSKVAKLKLSDRNYEMLQELNIRPRTTFLARVKNENQELS